MVGGYRLSELEEWKDKQEAMGIALRLQRIEDALGRIEGQLPSGKRAKPREEAR